MKKMASSLSLLFAMLLFAGSLSACGEADVPAKESATPTPQQTEQIRDEQSTGDIDFRLIGDDGNNEFYDLANVPTNNDSPLVGKTIYWLGSSVTAGTGSEGQAIAHLLEKTDGVTSVVEAVAGTTLQTLASEPERSYVSRMKNSSKFDTTAKIDAFFCQVSTNDCSAERISALGAITADDVTDIDAFDLSTAAGSVEYVIAYVHETWGCPVYFYSGAKFGDPGSGVRSHEDPTGSNYGQLVEVVNAAVEKWNKVDGYHVGIVDLYNDDEFNASVSDEDYEYLMKDAVHPRKAGYLVWWLPEFQEFLYNEFAAE